MITKIVYIVCFILFIPIIFKILRAIEIEKYFKTGHVNEIRLAYIIISIVIAELLTQGIERIFSLFV